MPSRTTSLGPFGISTGTPPAKGNIPLARQLARSCAPARPAAPLLQEAHLARPASLALARSLAFASCLARETLR